MHKGIIWFFFFIISFDSHSNVEWRSDALSWGDVSDAFEDVIDTGSSIIDDIGNTIEDFANSVASAFTSLGNTITGISASCATWLYSLSTESGYSLVSIYSVSELAAGVIDDLLDGFNQSAWDKLSDGAKYVVYNLDDLVDDEGAKLAGYMVDYLSEGVNFLNDLADTDDYMPFPFDVIESDDFFTVVGCMDDLVLESAIEFAETIATTLIDLGTDGDLDITPVFNTENIKVELNNTYECLIALGKELNQRESDSDDDNIIADLVDDAFEYFEFTEFVMGLEIGFTACTLVCGTASIGFAVNTVTNQVAPYYVVASGIDTSSVVGASIEAKWQFWPSWEAVAPGSGHVVSFDTGINIPFVSSVFGTTVGISIDDSGNFGGFQSTNDILDVTFGFNGAFGLGYNYASSYWITSLSDLGDAWNAFEEVGEIAEDNVELAIGAYDLLTNTLGSGGYLSTTNVGTSGVTLSDSYTISLSCPSGEESLAGNSSSLELGYIEVNEVIYGNITGDNWCNSSTAYSTVYDECAWLASCDLTVDSTTFDDPGCDDGVDYGFEIIYSCPSQGSVFDIGCFTTEFWEVIDSDWIEDGSSSYDFMYDDWETRENGIAKCSKIAQDSGYLGFAMWNHGMCLVGSNLLNDGNYNKYNSTECVIDGYPSNGLGSGTAMNVYIFATENLAFEDLGCYNTSHLSLWVDNSVISSMEGIHELTQESYDDRKLAVSKCAQIADQLDYDGFGLLDGGECYTSTQFSESSLQSFFETELNGVEWSNASYDCGTGKGNSLSFNVYSFPFASISGSSNSTNDGLSDGAIAAIIISILLFIIVIMVVAIMFYFKKKNNENSNVACCAVIGARINIMRERGSIHQNHKESKKNVAYISETDAYPGATPGAPTTNNNKSNENENTGPPLPPAPVRKQSDNYADLGNEDIGRDDEDDGGLYEPVTEAGTQGETPTGGGPPPPPPMR